MNRKEGLDILEQSNIIYRNIDKNESSIYDPPSDNWKLLAHEYAKVKNFPE